MLNRQRIYSVKSGSLNDNDRFEIARYLIKAGYAVRCGKEPVPGKKQSRYYVEYWEENNE